MREGRRGAHDEAVRKDLSTGFEHLSVKLLTGSD